MKSRKYLLGISAVFVSLLILFLACSNSTDPNGNNDDNDDNNHTPSYFNGIALTGGSGSSGPDLYSYDLEGQVVNKLTDSQAAADPTWNPSHNTIIFQNDRSIYRAYPGKDSLELAAGEEAQASLPSFSPGGDTISFLSTDDLHRCVVISYDDQIDTIFNIGHSVQGLQWSSDGKFFVYQGTFGLHYYDTEENETGNVFTPTDENVTNFQVAQAHDWVFVTTNLNIYKIAITGYYDKITSQQGYYSKVSACAGDSMISYIQGDSLIYLAEYNQDSESFEENVLLRKDGDYSFESVGFSNSGDSLIILRQNNSTDAIEIGTASLEGEIDSYNATDIEYTYDVAY